ncbi:MAG: hypothetical protein JNK15_20095 [Planctomycetes bacterium]|nr:hypothetical protein [Planctomycetota bacterium]
MHLFFALLASVPQGPTLVANVNDPASHGTVGDSLLSLDEAIRFANGTLTTAQMSAAEQARIVGTGTMLDAIVIDAAVTPTITLSAPLTDFVGPMVHHHVDILGMPTPSGVLPVLAGGTHPRVFTFRTYNVMLHELRIQGGQVGIDAQMQPGASPTAHMAEVMHCELDGQSIAGVRVHGTGLDESMVMLEHCELSNMPIGVLIDDSTAGGFVMAEGEHLHFDMVAVGCRANVLGAGGANMSMFNLFRSHFDMGTTLAELRRAPTSAQQFMFRIVHTEAHCSGHVLDAEGSAAGLTMVHHHHSDFVAGQGQKAFLCWPRTAQFDVHGSEMEFTGDVAIAANLTSPRCWQQNCRYHGGTVTIDVDGALPNLLWNHYENCTIDVPALARSPVAVRSSELINTTVNSAAFLAPVTLQGCLQNGVTTSGFVSSVAPAPAPFLGTTTVTPAEPRIGTSVTLATDLPFGYGLVWDIAESYARPTTTMEPVRFYGDPATAIILPAMVLFQSQLVVPIPNAPTLVGLEFYAQGITLPLLGQAWAPVYHLPRGSLVRLQP